jgi:hypothetical protein
VQYSLKKKMKKKNEKNESDPTDLCIDSVEPLLKTEKTPVQL